MGNSHSLVMALQTVLKERNLKVSSKTLETFVSEVDRCAPWFAMVASAPPPYTRRKCDYSFCSPKMSLAIRQMFPVFEDDGVRSHQPLEHKQVKELAESVRAYGVTANFTMSQIERLASIAMTPADWQSVTKACLLSMGQYIEWKALWHDACQAQARANTAAGQPAGTFEMLTGQGQWAFNQIAFPLEVYAQISNCAVKAWKALTNRGHGLGFS